MYIININADLDTCNINMENILKWIQHYFSPDIRDASYNKISYLGYRYNYRSIAKTNV